MGQWRRLSLGRCELPHTRLLFLISLVVVVHGDCVLLDSVRLLLRLNVCDRLFSATVRRLLGLLGPRHSLLGRRLGRLGDSDRVLLNISRATTTAPLAHCGRDKMASSNSGVKRRTMENEWISVVRRGCAGRLTVLRCQSEEEVDVCGSLPSLLLRLLSLALSSHQAGSGHRVCEELKQSTALQ